MVMLFAMPGRLGDVERNVKTPAFDAAFALLRRLETTDLGGVEPFGFVDGISQPKIDWDRARNTVGDQLDYSNVVALGEIPARLSERVHEVHRTAAGRRRRGEQARSRPRPTCPRKKTSGSTAPISSCASWSRTCAASARSSNGTRATSRSSRQRSPRRSSAARMRAKARCRRAQNPIPGIGPDPDEIRLNQFTYDSDPVGVTCPVGAHVRRANPRNADYAGRPEGILARLIALLGLRAARLPRRRAVADALPPRAAARARVRPGPHAGGGAAARAARRSRARAALHVRQREHRAPVRVSAERLDDEHEVRLLDRRDRSAAGQPRTDSRLPADRRR